jgi:hypothetical protein
MPPAGDDGNPFRRRTEEEDTGSEASFLTDDEGDVVGEQGGERRRGPPPGPSTWQEVDRAELSASALALISSIAQTAPADDRSRDAVWHPTAAVTVAAELVDPLGLGRIDPDRLALVGGVAGGVGWGVGGGGGGATARQAPGPCCAAARAAYPRHAPPGQEAAAAGRAQLRPVHPTCLPYLRC